MGNPETDLTDEIIELFSAQVNAAEQRSHTNARYVEKARRNIEQLKLLIGEYGEPGCIDGVIIAWWEEFKPIGECLFGTVLDDDDPRAWEQDFTAPMPTVVPDLYASLRIISTDEIMGPMIALDAIVH